MTDIVIPLGSGSIYKNFEIRIALRSIEKNISNVGQIFIIGKCPDFLQNVIHIHADDIHKIPDRNMWDKLMLVVNDDRIGEEFLYMHDDHYILKPFTLPQFPYFYSSTITEYNKQRIPDGYGKRSRNTEAYLVANNLPLLYYDIHYPMMMTKTAIKESDPDWKNPDGYVIKSLIGNRINHPNKEKVTDYKINGRPPEHAKVCSSYPHMRASCKRFLLETFPEMSRFEKTDI